MATYPREAWQRLGELLVARRVELDARYRNRREFARDVQMDYRVIYDIEVARRSNFGTSTLRGLELAYRLPTGALDEYLAGRASDLLGTPREDVAAPSSDQAATTDNLSAIEAALRQVEAVAAALRVEHEAAKQRDELLKQKDAELAEKDAEIIELRRKLDEGGQQEAI